MFRFFASLIAATVWIIAPAMADGVVRIKATGQAVETGVGRTITRRRALQEALIEAALSGGAEVQGYTATSKSVITADQLVVRPSSRILGYKILSEGTVGKFYRVTISALIGEPKPAQLCVRTARTVALAYRPQVETDYLAPAWLDEFAEDLAEAVQAEFQRVPNAELIEQSGTGPMQPKVSGIPQDMDYTVLTRQRRVSNGGNAMKTVSAPSVPLYLSTNIDLSIKSRDLTGVALLMRMDLRLIDKSKARITAEAHIERKSRIGSKLPSRALNQILRKDRATLRRNLVNGLSEEVAQLFGAYGCRPLVAKLGYSGGHLTLPFGSNDGLTKNHLLYTDRKDQPYILFEIATLGADSARLKPIDPGVKTKNFVGVPVRVMEGVQ